MELPSYDLPDDVFQPGETRPARPKKKVTKKVVPTAQKRRLEDLDVSDGLGRLLTELQLQVVPIEFGAVTRRASQIPVRAC
jgi:hypothetical protein